MQAPAPPRKRPPVSLVNFPRDALIVNFTERASIEALRRLGIDESKLAFKSRDHFTRRGVDKVAAKMLFEKHEKRRQEMINEALEMRVRVLRGDGGSMSRSGTRGHTSQSLSSPVSNSLKRIVVTHLRGSFQMEMKEAVVARTDTRVTRLLKLRNDKVQALHERTFSELHQTAPVSRSVSRAETPSVYVCPGTTSFEVQKRPKPKQASAAEVHEMEALRRSNEIKREAVSRAEATVKEKEQKLAEWHEKKRMDTTEKERNAAERGVRMAMTVNRAVELEKSRVMRVQSKIAEGEEQRDATAMNKEMEARQRMDERNAMVGDKSEKINSLMEQKRQQREMERLAYESREDGVTKRLEQQNLEKQMKLLETQFAREDKAERIGRMRAAEQYARENDIVCRSRDAELERAMTDEEQRRAILERENAEISYRATKNDVLMELEKWDGTKDPMVLKRIQDMMNLDEMGMDEIVTKARTPIPRGPKYLKRTEYK